jgi:hypothetical protein
MVSGLNDDTGNRCATIDCGSAWPMPAGTDILGIAFAAGTRGHQPLATNDMVV